MKSKEDVRPGDVIHIYQMFGEPEYSDTEGVVKHIDDMNQIHGTRSGRSDSCRLDYNLGGLVQLVRATAS